MGPGPGEGAHILLIGTPDGIYKELMSARYQATPKLEMITHGQRPLGEFRSDTQGHPAADP
jgi:hypothetical protein